MSAETSYLQSFFTNAGQLGLTVTSQQRPRSRPGAGRGWDVGLASFGWCNLGSRRKDANGTVVGLRFGSHVWFSDRRTNPGASPLEWQQFAANDPDPVVFDLSIAGDHVRMRADLTRWGASWTADSFGFESSSEQLLFVVPGAGAGAPNAVMLVAIGPGAGLL